MPTLNERADQVDRIPSFGIRVTQKTRAVAMLLAAVTGMASLSACAQPVLLATRTPVTMSLVDRESGQLLPQHGKDGEWFAPGRPGARYAIRLHNPTNQRLLAVLSVDGVNVISGETAAPLQSGYVLEPGARHDIIGWRKSRTEVAAFEFAALPDSYAARTGRPNDVGMIGMALFQERIREPKSPPVALSAPSMPSMPSMPSLPSLLSMPAPGESRAAAPSADKGVAGASPQGAGGGADMPSAAARPASPPSRSSPSESARGVAEAAAAARPSDPSPAQDLARRERLGTGHGQREGSLSEVTTFVRASTSPYLVIALRYDTRENLVAMGVIERPLPIGAPRPFPGEPSLAGFVRDPPLR